MGVDCRLTLPPSAQVADVADVLAALAGNAPEKVPFNDADGWYIRVPDVKVRMDETMPLARISFDYGDVRYNVLYHFEFGSEGHRGMMPRSFPFWIAACKRLADFFGGSVDYNDCDDVDEDYTAPEPPAVDRDTTPGYYAFQERKLAVKPLTAEEIAACAPFAAYGV